MGFEHIIMSCVPDWFFYTVRDWFYDGLISAVNYLTAKNYLVTEKIITNCVKFADYI